MDNLFQDLRYGFRTLLRRPGFSIVTVLILSLAIGANTAIFSVVNGVLIRPLGYHEPDRLMFLSGNDLKKATPTPVSFATFDEVRDHSVTFDQIACFAPRGFFIDGIDGPELVFGMRVSADFLNVFGVAPALGRGLLPGEDGPGVNPVAVLSHQLWQGRFGSDRDIVGKSFSAGEESFTVIGVMPREFRFRPTVRLNPELWVSLAPRPNEITSRGSRWLQMIGRLKPNATMEDARAEMNVVAARLADQYPDANEELGFKVATIRDEIVGGTSKSLLVLLGAVGFLLLIACANIASLLLAHGLARQKEIALRAMMGASRARLMRQMITESLALSLAGGAVGLVVVMYAIKAVGWLAPKNFPRMEEVSLDWRVFAFALILSAASGLIFGLLPALYGSNASLHSCLKYGSSVPAPSRGRLRNALAVAEIALSVVLLIGAGLMINSFVRISKVNKGFDSSNLLTVQLTTLARLKVPDQVSMATGILERVEGLPGVKAAGVIDFVPLSGSRMRRSLRKSQFVEGEMQDDPDAEVLVEPHATTAGYFGTMGIQILHGSGFLESDVPQALVSESLARTIWPGQDPVGKRIRDRERGVTVVGVVADVMHHGPLEEPVLMLYRPFNQGAQGSMGLVIRTFGDPLDIASDVRNAVLNADSRAVILDTQSMDQRLSDTVAQPRFYTTLLGWFGIMGALLATTGLYAVVSYSVNQRTHELGVRLAVGAEKKHIMRLIVGHAVLLIFIGVGLGLAGSFALTRLLSSLLFGVTSTDPLTFAGVPAVLSGVTLLASYIPARRATKVDPLVSLKYE